VATQLKCHDIYQVHHAFILLMRHGTKSYMQVRFTAVFQFSSILVSDSSL